MMIRFTKMHALGNDFMVVDAVNQTVTFTPEKIKAWANRHTGIGFDQCLIVEPSNDTNIDFFYRIYNADGSEVGQCGNGARCLARFIQYYQLSDKKTLTVATHTTRMTLQINADDTVSVNFGQPQWDLESHQLTIEGASYDFHCINVGNPHAIILTKDIAQAPVQTIGKTLSTHSFFPDQCNIGFMQILNANHIHNRVYERGCGETMACGSGAVAAAITGILFHNLNNALTVTLPGGDLFIDWPDRNGPIYLTGTATFVYEGALFPIEAHHEHSC